MKRSLLAAGLFVAVLWGGFFIGVTRQLAEQSWPEW